MCSLCSRLRRGILYGAAQALKANKIALGHHRDDAVETLFLNMFYGGRMKSMAPKLVSDDGKNMVIRPLIYCEEKDLASYARIRKFPIIPCNLCGSQTNLQRNKIKELLHEWEKENPERIHNIFRSMKYLTPSHLFDVNAFNFTDITATENEQEIEEILF